MVMSWRRYSLLKKDLEPYAILDPPRFVEDIN